MAGPYFGVLKALSKNAGEIGDIYQRLSDNGKMEFGADYSVSFVPHPKSPLSARSVGREVRFWVRPIEGSWPTLEVHAVETIDSSA